MFITLQQLKSSLQAVKIYIANILPTKVSDLDNDTGFITDAGVTSFNGSTGNVTYTAPVTSVAGKTGAVTLSASDVGALPSNTSIPTKTSDLTNDSNYLTQGEAADTYAVKNDIGKFISYTKTIESEVGNPSITITDAIANSKPSKFIINSEVNFGDSNSFYGQVYDADMQVVIQGQGYTVYAKTPTPSYSDDSHIFGMTFDLINQTSIINSFLIGMHGYKQRTITFNKDITNYPNIARASIVLPVQIDFNKEAKCNLANYRNCDYTELEENEFCIAPGQDENEVIIYLNTQLSVWNLYEYHFLFSMIPEIYPLNITSISYNSNNGDYTLSDFLTLNGENDSYSYTGGFVSMVGTQMIISYESTTPSKIDGKTYVDNQVSNLQTELSTKANSADLATVATSGSYTDLSNKPTIPTAISDLTDDSGHYTKPVNGIPASDLADGVIPENFSDRIAKGTGEASIITGDIENNAATGDYSYAGGGGSTRASANYAHAEGQTTYAEGIASHSEGVSTLASGAYSHAEGGEAIATGRLSHAEGEFTEANGDVSHAEGVGSITNGENSHAEGAYTITSHKSQHVFGEYNEIDPSNATADQHGNYVEIVGNGTVDYFGEETRSNARTLDWNGNEVLAGKLTVGSNPTNNMDVATKGYVDNSISNVSNSIPTTVSELTNDSNFTTKTYVDGEISTINTALSGKQSTLTFDSTPTANSTNPVTSGGIKTALDNIDSGVYIGSTAPTGNQNVWIDTSGDPDSVVEDVRIDGTSIVSNGVANIPIASSSNKGIVGIDPDNGIKLTNINNLVIDRASSAQIKNGTDLYKPLTPINQHEATFYGLAKVAGSDMASSNNAVGTYTDEAKAAIKSMLGVPNITYDLNTGIAITSTANLNTYTNSGTYYADSSIIASITNAPTTTEEYKLVVESTGNNLIKQVIIASNDKIYTRSGSYNSSTWTFTDWVKCITSVDYASDGVLGVIKTNQNYGLTVNNDGTIRTIISPDSYYKAGTSDYRPITISKAHTSTFYGLAKAAGDTTQSQSNNSVGIYTDNAKAAINTMIGSVSKDSLNNAGIIGRTYTTLFGGEFSVTTADNNDYISPYARASVTGRISKSNLHRVTFNGTEYILQTRLWYEINENSSLVALKVYEYLGNLDLYIDDTSGVVEGSDNVPFIIISDLNDSSSIDVLTESEGTYTILVEQINETETLLPKSLVYGNYYSPFEKSNDNTSTYNGLSIGVNDLQSSRGTFSIGYGNKITDEFCLAMGSANQLTNAKAKAIGDGCIADGLSMLAVGCMNLPSISPTKWQNNTQYKKGDFVTGNYRGVLTMCGFCIKDHTSPSSGYFDSTVNGETVWDLNLWSSVDSLFVVGNGFLKHRSNAFKVDWGGNGRFHGSVFVDCNENSTGGARLISENDYATLDNCGIVRPHTYYGTTIINTSSSGILGISPAEQSDIKTGTTPYKPIVPQTQHFSTFYGLAKAAGDITQVSSNNAIGTYTDNAKTAIKSMLGIVDGYSVVTVSGTSPTITAESNTMYVCGEVTSLSFTPCASGICDVRFTSGSTVTVLTIPNTVKFSGSFDPTSLETNKIYEINILDGIYGVVTSWEI